MTSPLLCTSTIAKIGMCDFGRPPLRSATGAATGAELHRLCVGLEAAP